MRVVFLENVPSVANAGEIKEVADGYGRNYLLPRKLAAVATPGLLKQLEVERKAAAHKEARLEAQAGELAQRLNGLTVTVAAKVGAQGRLYGSVTKAHIAEELQKLTGHAIDRRRILLEQDPIRHIGTYAVEVRLANDVSASINVLVQSNAPLEPSPALAAVPEPSPAEAAPEEQEPSSEPAGLPTEPAGA